MYLITLHLLDFVRKSFNKQTASVRTLLYLKADTSVCYFGLIIYYCCCNL